MARAESGQTRDNPLDLVEHIAGKHGWVMDRAGDDELTLTVTGQWADYHMSLNWRDDLETLQDLVVAAVRDASRAAAELTAQKMGPLAGGLGGGLGLPGL